MDSHELSHDESLFESMIPFPHLARFACAHPSQARIAKCAIRAWEGCLAKVNFFHLRSGGCGGTPP